MPLVLLYQYPPTAAEHDRLCIAARGLEERILDEHVDPHWRPQNVIR